MYIIIKYLAPPFLKVDLSFLSVICKYI
jgi:hypothetical protein